MGNFLDFSVSISRASYVTVLSAFKSPYPRKHNPALYFKVGTRQHRQSPDVPSPFFHITMPFARDGGREGPAFRRNAGMSPDSARPTDDHARSLAAGAAWVDK